MALDRDKLVAALTSRGEALRTPATLCLIGSAPAIVAGQTERQTGDIDVWRSASDFDDGDVRQAYKRAGISYDPTGDLSPSDVYLQIARPGVIALPQRFDVELVARFGRLTLADIEVAKSMLPREMDRKTATENLIIVRFVEGKPQ
jgi:hypothetical protein